MKLDIPFIKSRGLECGQACCAMIIKYFYPVFEPDFDKSNKIMHHTPEKYSFPLQNAILLDHYKVKAKCFSSEDVPLTSEQPDIFKKWFGNEYEQQIKYVDIPSHDWMVRTSRKKNLFKKRTTSFKQLLEIAEKNIVMMPIDWTTLSGRKGNYEGHFVIISGLQEDSIFIHDPDIGPNQEYKFEEIKKAWEHPIITDDSIVAYGKT